MGGGVDFLECMDTSTGNPASKAQKCATSTSLKWSSISACYAGDEGKQLLTKAATYFDGKFPKPVGVPRIEINGKALGNDRSYNTVLQALCATGIKAAACNKMVVV